MQPQNQSASAQIEFRVSEKEILETPRLAPIALQQMIGQLGLQQTAIDLEMEKHHGISIHEIIFVLLLYSSYGVSSIKQLAEQGEKDTSLANVIEDIKKIDNKVILYFQNNNEISTYEQLLDNIVSSGQNGGRLKSTKKGIVIVDDSPLIKTGKKMDKIEVIFDHVEKRYVLGYVLVATSYADKNKSYCVNFEFRFSSDDDRKRAEQEKLKKKEEIDLRKKGSLIKWIQIQINNGIEIPLAEVSGINLESETLKELDNKDINWLGHPSSKTVLLDLNKNRWNFESLKEKTVKNKPVTIEIEGWEIYTKRVYFEGYGELNFCIIKDSQDNELGCFLLKKDAMDARVSILQEFFMRQQPADNNKLNIALGLIERSKEAGIQAETAVGDSWFFVRWFMEKVLKIPGIKRFISKIKSNTEVVYKGQIIKVNELWEKVTLELISGRSIKAGAVIVKVKGFKNPIKIVLVQELDKCGQPKAKYTLVCTDINYSKEKIIEAYKLRWSIECFFRAGKQSFGLDKFHVRKLKEIHSHVTFSFISYLFLACLKISNPKLRNLTFGQILDRYLNSFVELKRTTDGLLVYLDPEFVKEFGIPYDTSCTLLS